MRLIDVDNFLKQYSDQVPGDTIDAIDLRLALLKEPKVDAIPIKWLETYVKNQFCLNDWYGGFISGVNMMLEDWEKENETYK